MSLATPNYLPDGSVSWEGEKPDIATRIREGDPLLGWLGDPYLELVLNVEHARTHITGLPRWEVWRRHPEGEPTLVVHCVMQRIDGDQLIRQLAAHDSRTRDMAAELLTERDKRRAAAEQEFRDQNEETADKLAWALGRDLSEPAQPGRFYPVS